MFFRKHFMFFLLRPEFVCFVCPGRPGWPRFACPEQAGRDLISPNHGETVLTNDMPPNNPEPAKTGTNWLRTDSTQADSHPHQKEETNRPGNKCKNLQAQMRNMDT